MSLASIATLTIREETPAQPPLLEPISSLPNGQMFSFNANKFIKIQPNSFLVDASGEGGVHVIDLQSFMVSRFTPDTMVQPLRAELIHEPIT